MFKYIHIQFGLTMYFTIKKDSFFTQDTRFSHCIEDNLFSQNFHSSAFRHDTSLGAHPGIVIKEGRRRGVPRGVSSRPTHNHLRPQLHMWLPTPFSSPPPPNPHPPTVSPTVVSPAQYQVPVSLTYLQQVSQTYFTYLSQSGSLKQKIGWHLPGSLKCAW